jgi:hypothetical protein
VSSTAAIERDPFQFASLMTTEAQVDVAQAAGPEVEHVAQEVRDFELPDLLAPLPVCLTSCS